MIHISQSSTHDGVAAPAELPGLWQRHLRCVHAGPSADKQPTAMCSSLMGTSPGLAQGLHACAGRDMVGALGAEVDRLETEIQQLMPGIRHIDLVRGAPSACLARRPSIGGLTLFCPSPHAGLLSVCSSTLCSKRCPCAVSREGVD